MQIENINKKDQKNSTLHKPEKKMGGHYVRLTIFDFASLLSFNASMYDT